MGETNKNSEAAHLVIELCMLSREKSRIEDRKDEIYTRLNTLSGGEDKIEIPERDLSATHVKTERTGVSKNKVKALLEELGAEDRFEEVTYTYTQEYWKANERKNSDLSVDEEADELPTINQVTRYMRDHLDMEQEDIDKILKQAS